MIYPLMFSLTRLLKPSRLHICADYSAGQRSQLNTRYLYTHDRVLDKVLGRTTSETITVLSSDRVPRGGHARRTSYRIG